MHKILLRTDGDYELKPVDPCPHCGGSGFHKIVANLFFTKIKKCKHCRRLFRTD